MVNPCPGYSITTPYGKEGSAWGCGWHDGADWAAPSGADVVAMWGGTVVEAAYPTSFGSAFGRCIVIDHDHLPDGSAGLWAIYAHLSSEDVSVGQRVNAGQRIGAVGVTGNVTGSHLHAGVYRQPSWCSGCGVQPQPWIDAQVSAPPPSSGYPPPTSNTVFLSKLHFGQQDSDSVYYLQQRLNSHSLPPPGNVTLPLTGNYLDQTSTVVVSCQNTHGFGNDPITASYVGRSQADHLFAGSGLTIVDDI